MARALGVKFFLFATGLVLVEETITTSMTNLAPEFGSAIGVAYITASDYYLLVIAFSSVVVLVPAFAGWMLLLRRFDFSPNEVLLLCGFLGTTMEASLNPEALLAGCWFFVSGGWSTSPYSIAEDRKVPRSKPAHYLLGYFVPLTLQIPVVVAVTVPRNELGIHLFPT